MRATSLLADLQSPPPQWKSADSHATRSEFAELFIGARIRATRLAYADTMLPFSRARNGPEMTRISPN